MLPTLRKSLLPFFLLFCLCTSHKPTAVKQRFWRMGTVIDITMILRGDGPQRATLQEGVAATWNSIDSLLARWEQHFSQNHKTSEVRLLNERKQASVSVSPILAEMIAIGQNYSDSLEGAFDLTVYPLKKLWGFFDDTIVKVVPDAFTIRQTLDFVDYTSVSVNRENNTVSFTDSNTVIDVGGIAKGFSLCAMDRLLSARGFQDYLIVAGGDIICRGSRIDGKPWNIGIKHPRQSTPLGLYRLEQGSIVTSGDYERFWMNDDMRVHHIFNPLTGYSCTKNQSLTVWGLDPIVVDVLSTGLFGSPKDSILSYINARPNLECLVVDSVGTISVSRGWENKIQFDP